MEGRHEGHSHPFPEQWSPVSGMLGLNQGASNLPRPKPLPRVPRFKSGHLSQPWSASCKNQEQQGRGAQDAGGKMLWKLVWSSNPIPACHQLCDLRPIP